MSNRILFLVLFCAVALSGCHKPKKISAEQFKQEVQTGYMQTMYASRYMGEKDGNVYLEWSRVRFIGKGMKKEIHYCAVKEMEPNYYEQLKLGTVPNMVTIDQEMDEFHKP